MRAFAGMPTVLILCRLTMRLTRSAILTFLAGFFGAIAGVGISESRIALHGVFIGLFAAVALYRLGRDHDAQLGRATEDVPGHRGGFRPWLVATGPAWA